jgi:hypothetical protein
MINNERKLDEQKQKPMVNEDVLKVAYTEVCNSYHSIDDFRAKLLGFLPLVFLV